MVMTGLLARTAHNLAVADPGFDKDRVLTFNVSLPAARYATTEDVETFYQRLVERLSALPGVTGTGFANTIPFSTSNEGTAFTIEGDETGRRSDYRVVSPDYLVTLGVGLVQGRSLTEADNRPDAAVALINEAFSRRYFPDVPAIGRRLRLADGGEVTIVGVAENARHWTLSDAAAPAIFVPSARDPRTRRSVVLRTAGDPEALAGPVRAAAAQVDPLQALYDVAPLSRLVENSFIPQRMASGSLVVFGLAALFLTCFGLYALLAFVVARRTPEIGMRITLGATPAGVLRLVLSRSLHLATVGLLIGLGLAMAGAQGLASLLYGVGPFDPVSYAGAAFVIGLVTLVASWLPARRALRVDPVVALRAD
jgi:predicted permease